MSIITQEERPLELYVQNVKSVRHNNVEQALEAAEEHTVDSFHEFTLNELRMDDALRISNGIGPLKMTEEALKRVLSFAKIPYGYVKNIDNQLVAQNFNDNIVSVKDREMRMCIKNYGDNPIVVSFCNPVDENRFESNEQIISRFQNDTQFGGNIVDINQSIYGIKLTAMGKIEHEILKDDMFRFGIDFNYSPTGQFAGYTNPSIFRLICSNGARVTYGQHRFMLNMKANQTLNDVFETIQRNFSYQNNKFIDMIRKSAETEIQFEQFKNIINSVDRASGNKELTNSVLNIDETERENIIQKAYEIASNEEYNGKKTYTRNIYDVYNDVTAYARDLTDLFPRMRLQSESFEQLMIQPKNRN